jgi:hypothetical protein
MDFATMLSGLTGIKEIFTGPGETGEDRQDRSA